MQTSPPETASSSSCWSTSSSVDTDEALLDMLGIDSDDYAFDDDDGRCCGSIISDATVEVDASPLRAGARENVEGRPPRMDRPETTRPINIDLPSRCSRYLHRQSQCCAFIVPSILSRAECRRIIARANGPTTTPGAGAGATGDMGDKMGSSTTSSSAKGKTGKRGFQYITEASHIDENGQSTTVKLQNPNPHKLCVYRDDGFVTEVLWERLRRFATINYSSGACTGGDDCHISNYNKRTQCGPPQGLNPRLRILRYDATDNDRFEPHFDATTRIDNTTSLLTVLVYLNDGDGADFDGGETLYLDSHVSNLNTALKIESNGGDGGTISSSCTRVTPRAGDAVVFEHDLYHSGAPLRWGTKYVMRTDVMFSTDAVGVDSAAGCRRQRMGGDYGDDNGDDGMTDNAAEDGDVYKRAAGDEIASRETDSLPSSITDLANTIPMTDEEKDYLDDIGLLHVTPETLLAPGVATVRLMLRDGVDEDKVAALLKLAVEAVTNNK